MLVASLVSRNLPRLEPMRLQSPKKGNYTPFLGRFRCRVTRNPNVQGVQRRGSGVLEDPEAFAYVMANFSI